MQNNKPKKNIDYPTLTIGNKYFRSGDYINAVKNYIYTLHNSPELSKLVASNLSLLQRKYREREKKIIAISSSKLDDSYVFRSNTLIDLYNNFVDISLVSISSSNNSNTELSKNSVINCEFIDIENNLAEIEDFITSNPVDIIHLLDPMIPNIILGILYKIIWGASIIIDFNEEIYNCVIDNMKIPIKNNFINTEKKDNTNFINEEGQSNLLGYLNLEYFEAITVSNNNIQMNLGGELIDDLPFRKKDNHENLYSNNLRELKKAITNATKNRKEVTKYIELINNIKILNVYKKLIDEDANFIIRYDNNKSFDRLPKEKNPLITKVNDGLNKKAIERFNGKIALVCHVYYLKYWPEISEKIKNIPLDFQLYITITAGDNNEIKNTVRKDFPHAIFREFPNRGRDIEPFVKLLPEIESKKHELICKIHTKRNVKGHGDKWRLIMIDSLLGNREIVTTILKYFSLDKKLGMVGPSLLYKSCRSLIYGNWDNIKNLSTIMYGEKELPEDWGFFAGSAFWVKTSNLLKFKQINDFDFEDDNTKTDGQIAHALERLFGLAIMKSGSVFGLVKYLSDVTNEKTIFRVIPPGFPSKETVGQTLLKINRENFDRTKESNIIGDAEIAYTSDWKTNMIKKSGYFNKEWYLSTNLDVKKAGVDPVEHYVKFGAEENRIPNPLFDTKKIHEIVSTFDYNISPQTYFFQHYIYHNFIKNSKISENSITYDNFYEFNKEAMLDFELIKPPLAEKDKRILGYMDYLKSKKVRQFKILAQDDLVSVIMPTYNRVKIIKEAIDSVLKQSYKNWELIIIDDNSEDNTSDYINNLNDDRVKLVKRNKTGGASLARNNGLSIAKGEFIAYLDSDDIWDKDFLLVMINELKSNQKYLSAYSAQFLWDSAPKEIDLREIIRTEQDKLNCLRYGPYNRSLMENHNRISAISFVHRRSLYRKLGKWAENMKRFVDWEFILRYTTDVYPLSIPIILSHAIDRKDEHRITGKENIEFAYSGIDNLLYSKNTEIHIKSNLLPNNKSNLFNLDENKRLTRYQRQTTIIIPSYEALDYLKLSIKSIELFTNNYEIIVVDNASNKGVQSYLKEKQKEDKLKLIINDKNYGFTRAVNQGISQAKKNNDIVIMNNDALVTHGWIEALREVIENVEKSVMAVPRQVLLPGEDIMDAHLPRVNKKREADINLSKHHKNILNPQFDQTKGFVELSYAPFFCVYIKRETFEEVGLLDEKNGPHYRSDKLYCDIVRSFYRKKIIYTPHSKVYHFHQQATSELKNSDPDMYNAMFKLNDWKEIQKVQKNFEI